MTEVRIDRQGYTEFGTLGRLRVLTGLGVAFTCLTAENPWRTNRPGESCVPEGRYELVRSFYHRGGYECFQLLMPGGKEIPGRTHVKVHVGNSDHDVEGCVVLGEGPVVHRGHWGVGPSKAAFRAFMEAMEGVDRCPLTVEFRRG